MVIAGSNVCFGAPLILFLDDRTEILLVTSVIIASILMHLSETKHKLPGIEPYNKYSWHFLQMDRLMAVVASAYCWNLFLNWNVAVPWHLLLIGLVFMALSELVEIDYMWFALNHCLWHFFAYTTLFYMLVLREQYTFIVKDVTSDIARLFYHSPSQ